jgi:hypothetical protein
MNEWPEWLVRLIGVLNALLPGGLWCLFWLLAVNWKKLWPVLAQGGWAPALLLLLVSAFAWSRIDPGECHFLPLVTIPNFWWQLASVSALAAVALFCGWLQGQLGWAPPEISLEPPAHEHGHHGHHGHH